MTNSPIILVVEDDPILRDLTQRQIALLGFEAVTVGSGEAAIDCNRDQINLILMDIGLPGIDGIQTTFRIRENELRNQRKRVPIVALTAHSDRDIAVSAGMDDFLQKPALLAEIKRIVEKWAKN